jgi:hypothetical protein
MSRCNENRDVAIIFLSENLLRFIVKPETAGPRPEFLKSHRRAFMEIFLSAFIGKL